MSVTISMLFLDITIKTTKENAPQAVILIDETICVIRRELEKSGGTFRLVHRVR